jgi:phosphate transport system substrate-binding protein
VFIYVKVKALERPEVRQFVDFYLKEGVPLVRDVGYIPLTDKEYDLVRNRYASKTTGSMFKGSSSGPTTLEQRLSQ